MDKSFLGISGFAPLLNRFLRQKNSLRFGERRKKGGRIRKPPFGFTVFKGSGRQYCMQSIPLAVLKHGFFKSVALVFELHAIHTACGIETLQALPDGWTEGDCMQSIPLAVLKLCLPVWKITNLVNCMQSIPLAVLKHYLVHRHSQIMSAIACNPYRLRY